jgi:hypothetical protein
MILKGSGSKSSRWAKMKLKDSNPDLFHAIDSRPVKWSGPEAGDWSPESTVDRDYASGLVSSLVISVVVKLTFSLGRHRVHLVRRKHRVIDVRVAAAEAPWCNLGAQTGHTHTAQLPPWRLATKPFYFVSGRSVISHEHPQWTLVLGRRMDMRTPFESDDVRPISKVHRLRFRVRG